MNIDTDRDRAIQLLHAYVVNDNLRKHMYAVEVAMRAYAQIYSEDTDWWGNIGLLHDFDYEKYPAAADHPDKGGEILRAKGYTDEYIKTIRAHADHTGEPRDTTAKKAIFAVDELCGLIVATALVKPHKSLSEVSVKSIKKKIKDRSFARQINRDEIEKGAADLDIALDDHIDIVLKSLQSIAPKLGL